MNNFLQPGERRTFTQFPGQPGPTAPARITEHDQRLRAAQRARAIEATTRLNGAHLTANAQYPLGAIVSRDSHSGRLSIDWANVREDGSMGRPSASDREVEIDSDS